MTLIRTDDVVTPQKLRRIFGLERGRTVEDVACGGCGSIHTCAGDWRKTEDGDNWVFWKEDE